MQKLLEQTKEIMNDPDASRNYQEPELEFMKEEDRLFLVDQIEDLRDSERKNKTKKKNGKKEKKDRKNDKKCFFSIIYFFSFYKNILL